MGVRSLFVLCGFFIVISVPWLLWYNRNRQGTEIPYENSFNTHCTQYGSSYYVIGWHVLDTIFLRTCRYKLPEKDIALVNCATYGLLRNPILIIVCRACKALSNICCVVYKFT